MSLEVITDFPWLPLKLSETAQNDRSMFGYLSLQRALTKLLANLNDVQHVLDNLLISLAK